MKKTILLILVAFLFSVGLRFDYINNIKNNPQFKYNNEYIINTNDGYLFAQGAKEIIDNKYNNEERAKFDHSAIDRPLSKITVYLYKLSGLKLETIIFYLSAFFSSLIVIPIILLGATIGSIEIGFIAALLSSIAWSYYNRTMLGYYDTDMLNIVFPAFLLWSIIGFIKTKRPIYILITAFEVILYDIWYPKSYSLNFSLIFLLLIYLITLIIFEIDYINDPKKRIKDVERKNYLSLILFMIIAVSKISAYIKFGLIFVIYMFYVRYKDIFYKYILYIFGSSVLIFVFSGGLSPIYNKLIVYLSSSNIITSNDTLHLKFFNVVKTISEASAIPYERVAQRISGSVIVFALSIIGYTMLLFRYRYFILSIPLVLLGLLAHKAGLRFTIYAIVPLSFGIAYLIYFIANYIKDITKNKIAYYGVLVISTIAILYPNIQHMLNYNKYITPVFIKDEIKTLDALKNKANPKDYIISWWDYGYPLKFYSGLNTMVDGGVHSGADNFPISYILTKSQEKAARMARLDVEYHEKRYKLILKEKDKKDSNKTKINDIEYMILDNGYKSANRFLSEIDKIKLPKKTRDIYLYLPDRMMRIFPVIEKFSNLDIESGRSFPTNLFMTFRNYRKIGNKVYFSRSIYIDLKRGIFNFRGQEIPINKFIITAYNNKNHLLKDEKIYNISSNINIIYMKSSGRFIVLDDKMLNSTYIQLFVLENYNKDLFKPIVLTPLVKIYKLQI